MTATRDNLVTLDITGMTCAACSARVERVLAAVAGVERAAVSLPLERADVHLSKAIPPARLVEAVEGAGYHAILRGFGAEERRAARQEREQLRAREKRSTRLTALIAVAAALPFFIDMVIGLVRGEGHLLAPWVQAVLATLCQVVCGARFYRGSWAALRSGAPNMDVLVALGTSAAYGLSLFNWLADRTHHGGLYFEASVAILAFVLIGKVLEGEAKSGASAALQALTHAAPRRALRIDEGREAEVPAESLRPGDRIVLRPGGASPVDGVIVEGAAAFDEALLTGESLPVGKKAGDPVIAGGIATGGRVVVEVVGTGDDTRLQRIARLIEDAEISKSPMQQLADRISAVFVPAVMVISVLSGLGWLLTGAGTEQALLAAVAVLVVACPCALGLATPIALVAGANAAARAGLIISDHAALEAAGRITRVAFDKTGTLTVGAPGVVGVARTAAGQELLLPVAASLAAVSDHPLDHALMSEASGKGVTVSPADQVSTVPGRGVQGMVAGRRALMGNAAFLRENGVPDSAIEALIAAPELRAAGSIALVEADGELLGAFGFADPTRAETADALQRLAARKVAVTVLSGDREAAVRVFAEASGVEDARGGLKPEDKIRAVQALRQAGDVVAVVGDGINDAPALRAADVGVAMGTGTEAAKAAAAVTLARPDPRMVASLIDAGRATRAAIAQNLAFAFVFNGVGIPLAAAGKLSPALAGAAMAMSSVSVVLNAWRLARRRV